MDKNQKRIWVDPRTGKRYTQLPKGRFLPNGLPVSQLRSEFITNDSEAKVKKALNTKPKLTVVVDEEQPNVKKEVLEPTPSEKKVKITRKHKDQDSQSI